MQVVVMLRIARAQHRGEALAGADEDLPEELLVGLLAAPAARHRDLAAVRQAEGHHVHGVAEGVLGARARHGGS